MRKKSHISLARYLVESLNDEGLKKHKYSFYLGSILPDIKPSFLYKRHEMTGTFPHVRKDIERLSEGRKIIEKEKKGLKYYMDLGQISHYLADYFTFPHDKTYGGSLKEHCSYEERLKKDLRSYIKSGEAAKNMRDNASTKGEEAFHSADALCRFIQNTHDKYITQKHSMENEYSMENECSMEEGRHQADDIHHIISVNYHALKGMIELLAQKKTERILRN